MVKIYKIEIEKLCKMLLEVKIAPAPQSPERQNKGEGGAPLSYFAHQPKIFSWHLGHNLEINCSLSVGVRSGIAT